MKNTYNKIKWMVLVCLLVMAMGITALGLNNSLTASAYVPHPVGSRNVYNGYATPSSGWYNNVNHVTESPMITVLTHGLGGQAANWSNNFGSTSSTISFGFAYDNSSLIEQLRNRACGANVFWAEMATATTFRLMELKDSSVMGQLERYYSIRNYDIGETRLPTISSLNTDDLAKHIIIVFEAFDSNGFNADVYAEFENMLNRIVYDVAALLNMGVAQESNWKWPTVNLIGHSRGGLTNMEYAQQYPKLVDSMFSLGTPYFGSNFGRINLFVDMLDMAGNDGFDNIQSFLEQFRLSYFWNRDYYLKQYNKINVYPMAGYSTWKFLDRLRDGNYLNNFGNPGDIDDLLLGIGMANWGSVPWVITKDIIADEIRTKEASAHLTQTPASTILDALEVVDAPSMFGTIYIYDDLFVSRDSQLGIDVNDSGNNYLGFNNSFEKCYDNLNAADLSSGADLSKVSKADAPIVHNLETRDVGFIRHILSKIKVKSFETYDIDSNTIGISSYINPSASQITIPDVIGDKTVVEIGDYTFYNYSGLTSVTIPDSVKHIGSGAFSLCSGLTSVTISNNAKSIGGWAFAGCKNLTNIVVPSSVTSIGDSAFYGCSKLAGITLPFVGAALNGASNTHFGYIFGALNAFVQSSYIPASLKTVVITGGNSIGEWAFQDCGNLTKITLPDGLAAIGDYAFRYCNGLTGIVVPDSVKSIGSDAFYGCNKLKSITLPFVGASLNGGSNTHFGYIFGASNYSNQNSYVPASLKTVIIKGGNRIWGSAFYGCSGLTDVTIPNGITSLDLYVFQNCTGLTNVSLPDGFQFIGYYVFSGCTGLTDIKIPDSVTTVDIGAFYNTGIYNNTANNRVVYADKWAVGYKGVLNGDLSLKPGTVGIASAAFSGYVGLTNVTIPNSVMYIGEYSFSGCNALTGITIPDGVTGIASCAFSGCGNLTLYAEAAAKPNGWPLGWNSSNRPVVWGCALSADKTYATSFTKTSSGSISNPAAANGIAAPCREYYSFGGWAASAIDAANGIAAYTAAGLGTFYSSIPNGTALYAIWNFPLATPGLDYTYLPLSDSYSVSKGAANTNGVIYIPAKYNGKYVTDIAADGFKNCSGITAVFFEESSALSEIGSSAFSNCGNLKNIKIPNSVVSICDSAFTFCSSLTSFVIPDGVTSIGGSAFCSCYKLPNITIPDSVTDIGSAAFMGCSGFTEISIPSSVTNIGGAAFLSCSGLTAVYIKRPSSAGITIIGSSVFSSCSSLTDIFVPDGASVTAYKNTICWSAYQSLIKEFSATPGLSYTYLPLTDSYSVSKGAANTNGIIYIPAMYNGKYVTHLAGSSFEYCADITGVRFENGSKLTSIGSYAFYGCSALVSFTIPDSVTSIGYVAFTSCSSLKSIRIPDGVTSIVTDTFFGCSGLTSVIIPDSVTSIGVAAFCGCSSLTSVRIPNEVKSIEWDTFKGCSKLTSIIIPDSVISIDTTAFANCSKLTAVYIERSSSAGITAMNNVNAFSGCSALTDIFVPDSASVTAYQSAANWSAYQSLIKTI